MLQWPHNSGKGEKGKGPEKVEERNRGPSAPCLPLRTSGGSLQAEPRSSLSTVLQPLQSVSTQGTIHLPPLSHPVIGAKVPGGGRREGPRGDGMH